MAAHKRWQKLQTSSWYSPECLCIIQAIQRDLFQPRRLYSIVVDQLQPSTIWFIKTSFPLMANLYVAPINSNKLISVGTALLTTNSKDHKQFMYNDIHGNTALNNFQTNLSNIQIFISLKAKSSFLSLSNPWEV